MTNSEIDMNNGNSIVLAFFEWDRKMEAEFKARGGKPMPVFRDPLLIGHFLNWLEQTEDGCEYIKQLTTYHYKRQNKNG